jgi:hypothetical protein
VPYLRHPICTACPRNTFSEKVVQKVISMWAQYVTEWGKNKCIEFASAKFHTCTSFNTKDSMYSPKNSDAMTRIPCLNMQPAFLLLKKKVEVFLQGSAPPPPPFWKLCSSCSKRKVSRLLGGERLLCFIDLRVYVLWLSFSEVRYIEIAVCETTGYTGSFETSEHRIMRVPEITILRRVCHLTIYSIQYAQM